MWNEVFTYFIVKGDMLTRFLIESTIALTLLYVPYTLILRKERFFRQNRLTLLAILILSLALPFCDFHALYPGELLDNTSAPEPIPVVESQPMEFSSTAPVKFGTTNTPQQVAFIEQEQSPISIIEVIAYLCILYIIGVLVAIGIRFWQFIRMDRLIRRGCLWHDTVDGITIYCHASDIAPYSWMRHIVISQHDYDNHRHEILLHERGHVLCHHSWDILLLMLVQTVQWFNPFVYMLGASLRDIHEYEADDYVLRQGVTASEYQTLLLKTAVSNSVYAFANNFNHSLIKNRIVMMKNKQTNPWMRYKALYILPLAVVLLSAFATPGTANPVKSYSSKNIDKRFYRKLDKMLLIYNEEEVDVDRFLELLESNRTPYDVLYAAPYKKLHKNVRKLLVPHISWMTEGNMQLYYARTKDKKAKRGVLILQNQLTAPSFSSGTNDFMIEGHVSSDIKDVAYQITLMDDNGQTTESTVHVKDGRFFYETQLDKPTKGRIRAIFEDGSLCQAWIEEIFYPGCKLNILVMDNTYTARNTPFTASR